MVKAKSSYAQISEKRLKSHNQKFKAKEKERRLPNSYFFSRQKEKNIYNLNTNVWVVAKLILVAWNFPFFFNDSFAYMFHDSSILLLY